ncbi:MAG: hypothetical protein JWP97_5102 [Labilithrix sp.]|nr:hypothetical protein [Labilithrix sp.]
MSAAGSDGAAPAGPARKSGWGVALRAVAALALLVVVFTRVPLRDLGARFASMHATDVLLMIGVALVQWTIATTRWWRLLARLRDPAPLRAIYGDLLVGALFNTFLPTNVGGDVVRALRASRRIEHGYHAWSSSLFERLVGMLTLAIAGSTAAVFVIGDVLPPRVRIVAVVIAIAIALGLLFVAAPLRLLVRVLEKRLSAAVVSDLRGVVSDLEGPLATAGARIETFAWSLAGFLVGLVLMSIAARSMNAPGHGLAILVGIPIISVLSLAPVSLGGHGLREGLFVVILGMLGVPKDVALGLALVALAYNVLFALLGGIVALVDPTPASAPRAS